jgi:hypothetical protein
VRGSGRHGRAGIAPKLPMFDLWVEIGRVVSLRMRAHKAALRLHPGALSLGVGHEASDIATERVEPSQRAMSFQPGSARAQIRAPRRALD